VGVEELGRVGRLEQGADAVGNDLQLTEEKG
jgi:hypothetical protein